MSGVGGGPPGLGFGGVDAAKLNLQRMVRGMTRLKEISEDVAADRLNIEKYVKELSDVCMEMLVATGSMLEQEHLRFINMVAAAGGGGHGGGSHKFPKAVMEHKIIQ
jgi:hypothetical protein